jgi:hypothetical protein
MYFIEKVPASYGRDCKTVRNSAVKSMSIRFIIANRSRTFL